MDTNGTNDTGIIITQSRVNSGISDFWEVWCRTP